MSDVELIPCKVCGGKTDWIDDPLGGLSPACINQKCKMYAHPFTPEVEDVLRNELANARVEIKQLREYLNATIDTLVVVMRSCIYASDDGAHGISQEAFAKIDEFITKYMLDKDTVSKGSK